MLADAEAVFDDIDRIAGETGRRFDHRMVMGRSLGSASALLLADHHPTSVKGLVLDSPFAFGPDLIHRLGGIRPDAEALPEGRDNIDRMRTCAVSTLILHGTEDFIIPVSDAEALYQSSENPSKRLVKIPGAGHNDLMIVGFQRYFSEIAQHVRRCVPAEPVGSPPADA
jgi:pimeloyl-ACP methyl ester carboxylesterase